MSPEDREEIKRHFDVVAEGLRSDIRLVADGVAMNTERVDGLGGRMERLEGTVDRLGGRVDRLDGKVDRLEGEMRHGFAELRSLLKPSNAELDRRLTAVERKAGGRKARM